ncbi:CLUMA_CG004107, isoform A [Clunio marinus]|uniref:CLUMA_CG004107, isoform A n=1 Tax=Clunio marinus TaxID=568069 RepID=A0A1J1HQF8_9DIPT|nr:CLUMA_CG004107, isoform A [Clunio marinus]
MDEIPKRLEEARKTLVISKKLVIKSFWHISGQLNSRQEFGASKLTPKDNLEQRQTKTLS